MPRTNRRASDQQIVRRQGRRSAQMQRKEAERLANSQPSAVTIPTHR